MLSSVVGRRRGDMLSFMFSDECLVRGGCLGLGICFHLVWFELFQTGSPIVHIDL